MIRKLFIVVSLLAVFGACAFAKVHDDAIVSYGNASFNAQGLDFAAGVTHRSWKYSPLKPNTPPGDEWPSHLEFKFPHYFDGKLRKLINPNNGEQPNVEVYPTANFYTVGWEKELRSLKSLLSKRSSGSGALAASTSLPYLPTADAAQMLHANAIYLYFQSGMGIRYITQYAQDVSPYTSDSFFYTFQGLSKDGKTYISATFPLYTTMFPKQISTKFDFKDFGKREASYKAAGVKKLNSADLSKDFTPLVALLDRLVSSIKIDSGAMMQGQQAVIAITPLGSGERPRGR